MSSLLIAKSVITTEILGLEHMANQLDSNFDKAIEAIINSTGRVIVCGMGKSGLIGKKIVSSFASTGTPSFFMHPGEAFHGDLGMVKSEDVFIAISNSGETDEVLRLLPFLISNGNFVIAMTGKPTSTLAVKSHCHLNVAVPLEACPLQLAPTSSTTATLVMGDALTVVLMGKRQFKPENFARFHPGGSLGRRLLGKVSDDMFTENLPTITLESPVTDAINTISSCNFGVVLVLQFGKLKAVITDGDLRRAIVKYGKDIFDLLVKDICTFDPLTILPESSIQEAYDVMDDKKVNVLIVVENTRVLGILKK
ncbi:arabinose-5-phosphate isomerase [Pseudoalteromonas nigrifaciens]|uniref:Arabinose 5-phosphate isomerase n=1 Tax=Pseudoalteromonas nigrifaciens TaxID=28109 RepID=A0AAC9XVY8_9GAMM|nr:KpsF/GutQ family sugar-phosphate isomerase [Pseudoalteromonas nigrifaciens]ASM52816.1 arabinose-5-phosphate isomerase [Pseudoalteromonas nigrifaciens]GEN43170.1 arabinose 5-phosphate isomerase [Pseudoalteromonas nigrifaciens]SUC53307.1 Arabinose 5-phosphate isomerase KpsF [Pseudoalteromonas nigrifaciens]